MFFDHWALLSVCILFFPLWLTASHSHCTAYLIPFLPIFLFFVSFSPGRLLSRPLSCIWATRHGCPARAARSLWTCNWKGSRKVRFIVKTIACWDPSRVYYILSLFETPRTACFWSYNHIVCGRASHFSESSAPLLGQLLTCWDLSPVYRDSITCCNARDSLFSNCRVRNKNVSHLWIYMVHYFL